MRPEYDGVKFYSDNDMSIGMNFEKAKTLVDEYTENAEYTDINSIIELYNVCRIIESPGIKAEYSELYLSKTKSIMATVARFFSNITDDNIIEQYSAVDIIYTEDFWLLFNKLTIYKCISDFVFQKILNVEKNILHYILKYKGIVRHYDSIIADYMRKSDQSARIIVSRFLEKKDPDTVALEMPSSLSPDEYEIILQKYIESERPNIGVLQLIASSQSSVECPISDSLRLLAKQKAKLLWESGQFRIADLSYGVEIEFKDSEEIKAYTQTNPFEFKITYDIKWINDNMDYPTLLNNFIYLFEYTDFFFRCTFISAYSHLGIFERSMGIKGKKEYETGMAFRMEDIKSSAEMKIYSELLSGHNIRIEDLIKWFFSDYLKDEFMVEGFTISVPSSNSTIVEKCRSLLSEMDGILKQYNLYVKCHTINRTLLEMSSNPVVFSNLPSMIENKYAYLQSDNLRKEIYLLFSDQCMLSYVHEKQISENCFFELIRKHRIYVSDYPEWSQADLQWLKDRDTIDVDKSGLICFNIPKVALLKDLYEHEVVCTSYRNKELISQMATAGDLRYGSSLLSEPEQKYFNYVLNKSEFSNGLDLRNRYIHGSNTLDEERQKTDYLIILKLMIIVVIKINEEFCLMNPE